MVQLSGVVLFVAAIVTAVAWVGVEDDGFAAAWLEVAAAVVLWVVGMGLFWLEERVDKRPDAVDGEPTAEEISALFEVIEILAPGAEDVLHRARVQPRQHRYSASLLLLRSLVERREHEDLVVVVDWRTEPDEIRELLASLPTYPPALEWDWWEAAHPLLADAWDGDDVGDLLEELGKRCVAVGAALVSIDTHSDSYALAFVPADERAQLVDAAARARCELTVLDRTRFGEEVVGDEIDAMVNYQLAGEDSRFDRALAGHAALICPQPWCSEEWHGLAITARMLEIRLHGEVDPRYDHRTDDSPVLCPGSTFTGEFESPKYEVAARQSSDPEPQPRQRGSTIARAAGRLLVVAVAVVSFGFLAGVPLLVLAHNTGRRLHWWLGTAAFAIDVLIVALFSTDPGEEISTWRGELAGYLLFGTLVASVLYYIAADVRRHRR